MGTVKDLRRHRVSSFTRTSRVHSGRMAMEGDIKMCLRKRAGVRVVALQTKDAAVEGIGHCLD